MGMALVPFDPSCVPSTSAADTSDRVNKVEFRIVESAHEVDRNARNVVFLWNTGWDDWFEFETLHRAYYIDQDGRDCQLGDWKIGEVGLQGAKTSSTEPSVRRPNLPKKFKRLPDRFFSLGQDDSYYEVLSTIGAHFREDVLHGLRDIAFDEKARRLALSERVTKISLLRSVTLNSVEDQFARMAHGGARLTPYSFSFRPAGEEPRPSIRFSVEPGSRPPSNIHVIIGRNGVGKSTLLKRLAHTMVTKSREDDAATGPWDQLSNIVSVSFSAFDEFEPMKQSRSRSPGLTHHYVGLKKVSPRG